MKSRIFLSMLVIALAAALVGGATMAVFTSDAQSNERTYAAGTVKIAAHNQSYTEGVTLKNMQPGDTIEGSFVVKNSGSLPLWFEVSGVPKQVEGSDKNYLFGGGKPAVVTIDNPTGTLDPAEEKTINFSVYLPLEADDWYQGAEGELYFKVHAEQLEHNAPNWNDNGGGEDGGEDEADFVTSFGVKDFKVEHKWHNVKAEIEIENAEDKDGNLITAAGKEVRVELEMKKGNKGRWTEYSGVGTVDLEEGEGSAEIDLGITDDASLDSIDQMRWDYRNIVVTIDDVSVYVNRQ